MELFVETCRITRGFPGHERFGLTSQARRAAASVPANIAEGHGRTHRGEYLHHVGIARGSLMELDSHLEGARRLGYLTDEDFGAVSARIDRLGRMLTRLAVRLRESPTRCRPPMTPDR